MMEKRDCLVGVPVRLAAIPRYVLASKIEGKQIDQGNGQERLKLLSGEDLVVLWYQCLLSTCDFLELRFKFTSSG